MFYAIEHAYGGSVVNNGQRADRVLEFTSRRLRDVWVSAGPPEMSTPGYRDTISARHPKVRKAEWRENGDLEAWQYLAEQRVFSSPKLCKYWAILAPFDDYRQVEMQGTNGLKWLATADEVDVLSYAERLATGV
jgi:hypothetical protein